MLLGSLEGCVEGRMMKVLVACEYSGRVRDSFLARGHNAISCDLLPTDKPGPHYQGDVRDILYDGWDLMIAHPDCTYLTGAAEWAYGDGPYHQKVKPGTLVGKERWEARQGALDFVTELWNAPIKYKCIENPVGVINRYLKFMPEPQYVQQYWFGEDASKKTGLWLDNLPELHPTKVIMPRMVCGCGYVLIDEEYNELSKYGCPNCLGENKIRPRWGNQTDSGQNKLPPSADRWKIRSITPLGMAEAMAEQWSKTL